MYSLTELNVMHQDAFTAALGSIFEHTPAITRTTWLQRPFQTIDDLYHKLLAVVQALTPDEQLSLLRSHPDLGAKAKMADASVQEQASVGLDQLSPSEYETFQTLNQGYKTKFDFPFIIAVRNHTKTTILEAFESRLHNSVETEMQQAIAEINQIAYFRLLDLVSAD